MVAVGGYSVVALGALAYGVIKLGWPGTPDDIAGVAVLLIASPLALALLWHRLAGVKAFGVEFTLTQFAVATHAELASVIAGQQYFSGSQDIIRQLNRVIARSDTELIEVNLRDGNYWWVTRLFLLAALIGDYSDVRVFVFVEAEFDRRFIGFASSSDVRRALATAYPPLEAAYRQITEALDLTQPASQRFSNVVYAWTEHVFNVGGQDVSEQGFPERVNRNDLQRWLQQAGGRLVRDSVEWSGVPDSRLVHTVLVDFALAHVALLRRDRLDRIINRLQLAVQLASRVA